jgi:tetratricopeptide (TPR) repeat protein
MKKHRKTISKKAAVRMTALMSTALLCSTAASAAEELTYSMTTIIDSPHGSRIAAGNYEQAIEKIAAIENRARSTDVDSFYNQTNLCVAFTKLGNIDDALSACDAAVEMAGSVRFVRMSQLSTKSQKRKRNDYLAMALSNRGVMYAVKGEIELARKDFVDAMDARTNSSSAKANLARLGKEEIRNS